MGHELYRTGGARRTSSAGGTRTPHVMLVGGAQNVCSGERAALGPAPPAAFLVETPHGTLVRETSARAHPACARPRAPHRMPLRWPGLKHDSKNYYGRSFPSQKRAEGGHRRLSPACCCFAFCRLEGSSRYSTRADEEEAEEEAEEEEGAAGASGAHWKGLLMTRISGTSSTWRFVHCASPQSDRL